MNISKSSMSYRFMDAWSPNMSDVNNVCKFVRRFIYCLGFSSFILTLIIMVSLALLWPAIFLAVDGIFFGFDLFQNDLILFHTLFAIGSILWCIIFLLSFAWFIDYGTKHLTKKIKKVYNNTIHAIPDDSLVAKESSILWSWIKSKHDKVCLNIKFVDKD